jgi:hypothetical protein
VVTAQQVFNDALRLRIAPALRSFGFKGSGAAYELPSDSHWAILGFQKSVASDRYVVKFTINLTVVSKDIWDAERVDRSYLSTKPTPNVQSGPFAWEKRIGSLMPDRSDHWWSMSTARSIDPVVEDVLFAIQTYALPAMKEHMEG